MRNALKIASLAAAALLATTSASAQVVTFASFLSNATGTNMRFARNASTNSAAGRSMTFFTTSSASGNSVGGTAVAFQFNNLGAFSTAIGNVGAVWTMNGTVTDTAATLNGSTVTQTNLTGTFSIIANTPINYGSGQNAVVNGTNLLSGTFSSVTFSGGTGGSTGGIAGSTTGGSTISFTSDFLTFLPGSNLDMGLTLTSIAPLLGFTANRAVHAVNPNSSVNNVFRAAAIGSFSADPPPVPPAVPEPGTWAMMITGIGLVGFARRRRRTVVAA
jgi:hypothetical protein